MKLYFYFLEKPYNGKAHIREEECEVEEKHKSYQPVDRFPKGYYGYYVTKQSIGVIIKSYYNHVILTEKNKEKAFEIFNDYFSNLIRRKEEELAELKETLEVIEDWSMSKKFAAHTEMECPERED